MPSLDKATYGPIIKKRARRLLDTLLAYANNELEDVDGISMSYRWKDETSAQPKLVIETKLRMVIELTNKDPRYEGRLEKDKISQALNHHLSENFLNILEDHRTQTQGAEDWHFTLTLWSKDRENNLNQFDIEWERKRPLKSKQQEKMLRETLALETPLPSYEPLTRIDWGEAPDVSVFFGRTKELVTLEKWILEDRCRLIAIVGMGGIGKTSLPLKLGKGGIGKTDLSLKLAQGITEEFDYLIWRDLKNSPPLE